MYKCPGWPIDHPDVHEQFMQGQRFSVQLGRTSLAESQSTRKLKKPSTRTHRPLGGGGGDKRFSLKPGADSRNYLTSEYRRSEAHIILRELRDMVSKNSLQHFNHPDLQLSRIRKDETDVCSFVELIKNSWAMMKQSWSTCLLYPGPTRYCQRPAESSQSWKRSIPRRSFGKRATHGKLSWQDEKREPEDLPQHQ